MPQRKIKTPKWHLLISLLIISLINLLPINLLKANPLPTKADFNPIMQDLSQRFGQYSLEYVILIVASEQKQYLLHNGAPIARYTISTSEFGMGNRENSNKTPWGVHIVTQKYGTNAKIGTIFKARINTGKVAKILTESVTNHAITFTTMSTTAVATEAYVAQRIKRLLSVGEVGIVIMWRV